MFSGLKNQGGGGGGGGGGKEWGGGGLNQFYRTLLFKLYCLAYLEASFSVYH